REAAHADRMRPWTEPHRRRRSRGEPHPVLDFLFTYYSHPPTHLARWQPGPDVVLTGEQARRFLGRSGYRETDAGISVDPAAFTDRLARTTRHSVTLLEAVDRRRPRLNCFGLHEWAMVYRADPDRIRHSQVPLRLGSAGTDEVVETSDLRCGHFDAFRFFTDEAVPRNRYRPTRDTQVELDQPGCLHVGMDLYKWAYKLGPFVPAELVADCFELAADIRTLDMRASPYDLRGFGYPPVRIETAEGRAEYARAQAGFARRAAPLRGRLISLCRGLLTRYADHPPEPHPGQRGDPEETPPPDG
ncbi:3-methyladenine DNA glycosylase, partial [Saccharomonospora halophila]|uniref:3-methyladenine DNA glycosylase n=1 Tax=Saccharomonospora halophila TaxID=129922 RepID=UPI000A015953